MFPFFFVYLGYLTFYSFWIIFLLKPDRGSGPNFLRGGPMFSIAYSAGVEARIATLSPERQKKVRLFQPNLDTVEVLTTAPSRLSLVVVVMAFLLACGQGVFDGRYSPVQIMGAGLVGLILIYLTSRLVFKLIFWPLRMWEVNKIGRALARYPEGRSGIDDLLEADPLMQRRIRRYLVWDHPQNSG